MGETDCLWPLCVQDDHAKESTCLRARGGPTKCGPGRVERPCDRREARATQGWAGAVFGSEEHVPLESRRLAGLVRIGRRPPVRPGSAGHHGVDRTGCQPPAASTNAEADAADRLGPDNRARLIDAVAPVPL